MMLGDEKNHYLSLHWGSIIYRFVKCVFILYYLDSNFIFQVDINVGGGAVNGSSSGTDNEGFWFDEEIGLGRTRREAEELRLQQLQIEQEVNLRPELKSWYNKCMVNWLEVWIKQYNIISGTDCILKLIFV